MISAPFRYDLSIAGLHLCLQHAAPLEPDPAFAPFLTEDAGEPDCLIQFRK